MAHHLRAARLGAVAGLFAAAIAGCGSAGKTSAQSTGGGIDQAFIARVTTVCNNDNAITAQKGKFPYPQFDPSRPQADLLPKVGAYFKSRDLNDIPEQLAALGQPTQGTTQWDQLRALVDQNDANIVKQINAALASDGTAFIATLAPAQNLDNQMLAAARQAGFPKNSPCDMAIY
jgi:hypothetical protein